MNSATFQTYRHSGKFGAQGPLLALLFAVVAGFPLGYAYAYLIKWIPIIYFNVLATIGYGAVFGLVCGKLMKYALVRNNMISLFTAAAAGVIGLYFAWNGHVHATFQNAPVFCFPDEMAAAMRQLYDEGSWGMHTGEPVTGIPLAIVWVVEAGIILAMSIYTCYRMVGEIPFCETSRCWLDQTRNINTLAPYSDSTQVAAFKSGDLGPLTQAKPRDPLAGHWTRIVLKHSPRCQVFNTVRLQDVKIYRDKKGNPKEKVKNLSRDLILPADMFGLITKFESFGVKPEGATDAIEETSSQNSTPS